MLGGCVIEPSHRRPPSLRGLDRREKPALPVKVTAPPPVGDDGSPKTPQERVTEKKKKKVIFDFSVLSNVDLQVIC